MTWPRARLDACSKIISGATPRTNELAYWDGSIHWATPKDLSSLVGKYITDTSDKLTKAGYESCSTQLLPPQSVLFSSRAPIGHVAINTVSMCTNQGFKSFVPDSDILHADYLYHWLRSHKTFLQSLGNGATFKEVSKDVISRVEIPLPPLPEQRRIAAILDKADSLRVKRREAIDKLDSLLQSVFLEMFGDPIDNPYEWPTSSLESLSDPRDRINYGVVQPGAEIKHGVPMVRVGDFDGGSLSTANMKRIDPAIERAFVRSRLQGNELLVSCVGSIGLIADVPESAIGYNIARAITRVPLIDPRRRPFIREMLRTPGIQYHFQQQTRTVSQPTLNVAFVKSTPVICPPEALQRRFVEISHSFEKQRQRLLHAGMAHDELFISLQHRAFIEQI